jgi:hypothetical protein
MRLLLKFLYSVQYALENALHTAKASPIRQNVKPYDA